MRRPGKSTLAAGMALLLSGCHTMATDEDRPARIVSPDDASRAALQNTINTALRTTVVIADDALTDSSVLVIERSPPRTMQNPDPQGLILEAPIRLRLVISGSDCVLIDERDGARYVLENTRCEAE